MRQFKKKESSIERLLVKEVQALKGMCIKMIPTYEAGIPDRLVLYKGRAIFVELKREGEKPRAIQVFYMEQLKATGFECRVIDSVDGVYEFLKSLE